MNKLHGWADNIDSDFHYWVMVIGKKFSVTHTELCLLTGVHVHSSTADGSEKLRLVRVGV